ncbi:hypothetical protein PHJA_002751000 [Phtheirospermum japonicum]|uniref:Uncharacterized protein n=1 Tax=Phtheirospermum japonicum TaxID=374723 RepID=A0A830D453_9LAMI|nr:hypothetical protein PHJA_002751000 [Phtheirospermum japonicum]
MDERILDGRSRLAQKTGQWVRLAFHRIGRDFRAGGGWRWSDGGLRSCVGGGVGRRGVNRGGWIRIGVNFRAVVGKKNGGGYVGDLANTSKAFLFCFFLQGFVFPRLHEKSQAFDSIKMENGGGFGVKKTKMMARDSAEL